jgi:DNA-binding transcriptional ArsR family regulator
MRPVFHPSIQDVTVEGLLHALSDPARVAILAEIVGQACPQTCSHFLKLSERTIPKSTLSQHFKILREAGLIRSVRHGVEVHNTARLDELERRFPGLIKSIIGAYTLQSATSARRDTPGTKPGAKTPKKKFPSNR